jgi:hypothetical protein
VSAASAATLGTVGHDGPAVDGLAPMISSVTPIPDASAMLALGADLICIKYRGISQQCDYIP